MKKQETVPGTLNRVTEDGVIVLTKQYVVVWFVDEEQVVWLVVSMEDNTGNVYPGMSTFYAEFDTKEEYDQYLTDNNLNAEIL